MTSERPELDRIIGALRSPATTRELAGEDEAVIEMHAVLAASTSHGANVRAIGSSRSPRIVAIVAASIIGVGGIAAAGAATFQPSSNDRGEVRGADAPTDDAPTDETVTDDTVIDDTATDDTVIEGDTSTDGADPATAPLVDDPATEFDETQCAEGNHGATVSSIAQETPSGPGHGDEVSIAAQSSCGKDATPDDDTTDDVDDDATVITVAGTADDDDSPGNGNGNGSSNGNSNGNGRGNGKPGG